MRLTYRLCCSGIFLCLLGTSFQSRATVLQVDTLKLDTTLVVEEFVNLPTIPEATLRERLPKLQRTIPMTYNKTIHGFIDYFAFRRAAYTRTMLERMPVYFPIYEKYLAQYGLPDELKYLSIVESGLSPRAISHAGAGGLWQFMPGTGRDMRLYQDEYIDERMDPIKATEAACKYLRDLYRQFGDWELALAAYNSGPGKVRKAMQRSGGTTFWTCYDELPKETRAYVPQFVAFTYLMHYAGDHGIVPEHIQYPIPFDTIQINSYLNVESLAKHSTMPLAELQQLNPHITSTILPAETRNFTLRVPSDKYHHLLANRIAIMDSATREPVGLANALLADVQTLSAEDALGHLAGQDERGLPASQLTEAALFAVATEPVALAIPQAEEIEEVVMRKPKKITYTVRRGDNLGEIAEHFHVDLYDLKHWNHLRKNTVQRGQELIILREVSQTRTQQLAVRQPSHIERATKAIKPRTHRVQQGDTLWTIAQRYGVPSIDKLKKINHIKGNSLKPGQKLIVG